MTNTLTSMWHSVGELLYKQNKKYLPSHGSHCPCSQQADIKSRIFVDSRAYFSWEVDPSQLDPADSAGVVVHRGKLPAACRHHSAAVIPHSLTLPASLICSLKLSFSSSRFSLSFTLWGFSNYQPLPQGFVVTGSSDLHLHDKHKVGNMFSERECDPFSLDPKHKAHRRFEMRFSG